MLETLQKLSQKLDDTFMRTCQIESLLICLSSVNDSTPGWTYLPNAIYAVVEPLQRIESDIDSTRTELDKLTAKTSQ